MLCLLALQIHIIFKAIFMISGCIPGCMNQLIHHIQSITQVHTCLGFYDRLYIHMNQSRNQSIKQSHNSIHVQAFKTVYFFFQYPFSKDY